MTYEYHNNVLSIPAKLLYKELDLIGYRTYLSWVERGKLVRTKYGRGKNNEAWISYYDIAETWVKNAVKAYLGDPKEVVVKNQLENYIKPDPDAVRFFASHRKPDGNALSAELQRQKTMNCMILNAIKTVFKDRNLKSKMFGKRRIKIWQNVTDAVNALHLEKNQNDTKKYIFKLPGNWRKLKAKYEEYLEQKYSLFIHGGEGQKNRLKIKDEVADFLKAQYALPIALTIPEVLERYELFRLQNKELPAITSSAVYNYLYQPEVERVWTLGRNGREVYNKKFKHTLSRDKQGWFPNIYWAIDGTKLDWVHFWEESSNKIGAKLKIDVMFDVYSEKIIGWALSFTESHIEHFKAIKMAVNEAQCRPYLLTYDNQGGHKMDRMKTLYNSLVAHEKGTHYPHRTKEHNSPAEQLFKRLQQQVINKFWYSDGQSVTVKRDDNKMNTEFVLANKDLLKTVEELHEAWEATVNIWNSKTHPQFKTEKLSRNDVYAQEMPMREDLSLYEIMDKMWIEQKKRPITYKSHGLELRLGDKKHRFEVYDVDGNIDTEFRRKNVGKKFIVRYDPDFLDGYIQLCDRDDKGNIVHIANAEPKRNLQVVPVLMKDGDKEQWAKDYAVRDIEFERDSLALKALQQRTGITPEKEMQNQDLLVKLKGDLTKFERSKIEADENLTLATSRL